MNGTQQYRYFLKDTIRKSIDFRNTDQHRGVPAPPIEKPDDSNARRVQLPDVRPMDPNHCKGRSCLRNIQPEKSAQIYVYGTEH